MNKKPMVILTGPTAVGKTELSIKKEKIHIKYCFKKRFCRIFKGFCKKVDQCWDLYDQGKYDEAYKMVLPIAKKGIGKAINMMATLHEKGKGVPADLNKAIEWYELGIKKDYWACFNNLGNLYYNYSVDENQGKVAAYQFYKQVIYKTNKVVAKRALDILLSGLVPYNEDEKQQWIKRLIELGEEEYVNALNK